jgi:hypothetical protein
MAPYVPLLVAIFTVIVGGFVGAHYTRRTDHVKWLRDQRLESYAGFLTAATERFNLFWEWEQRLGTGNHALVDESSDDSQAAITQEGADPLADPLYKEYLESSFKYSSALFRLQLLAPWQIVNAAQDLDKILTSGAINQSRPEMDSKEFGLASTKLIVLIRNDIGVK